MSTDDFTCSTCGSRLGTKSAAIEHLKMSPGHAVRGLFVLGYARVGHNTDGAYERSARRGQQLSDLALEMAIGNGAPGADTGGVAAEALMYLADALVRIDQVVALLDVADPSKHAYPVNTTSGELRMTLSKDAQEYLDHFGIWDPEGPTMNGLWAGISSGERDEIRETLRDQMHARNADHAAKILHDLPKKWRDSVIDRLKDLP